MSKTEYQAPSIIATFYILILIVALSPLFFGSNTPLFENIIFTSTGVALSLWTLSALINNNNINVKLENIYFLIIPFIALITWLIFQINSPFWTNSIWYDMAVYFPDANISKSISINKTKTIDGIIRFINFAAIFFISLQLCKNKKNASLLLNITAICAVIYALYGIYIEISGTQSILWLDKKSYKNDLTSTFINRNSYATYAGIGFLICLNLTLTKITSFFKQKYKHRLFEQFINQHLIPILIPLTASLITISALIMSHSRAGISATLIAAIILFLSHFLSHKKTKLYKILLFSLCIISTYIIIFIVSLKTNDFSASARSQIYSQTISALQDKPFTGTGLATFQDIFKQYRNSPHLLNSESRIQHAHNVYLETLCELGIIGFIFFILPFSFIATLIFQGVIHRQKDRIFTTAPLSIIILVGLHSLVDFSVQIPAISATFAALLGMGCAQSWSSREKFITTSKVKILALTLPILIILLLHGTKQITTQLTDKQSHHEIAIKQINAAQEMYHDVNTQKTILNEARKNLETFLSNQPASPYAWLDLATTYGIMQGNPEKIRNSVLMSVKTGPYALPLIARRVKYALIDWKNYNHSEQNNLNQQICLGWQLNKEKTAQTLSLPKEKQHVCNILPQCGTQFYYFEKEYCKNRL